MKNTILLFLFILSAHVTSRSEELVRNLGKTLSFAENKGQLRDQYGHFREDVDFVLSANGLNIFIGAGKIYYQWIKPSAQRGPNDQLLFDTHRLEMELVNVNKDASVITGEKISEYEIYWLDGEAVSVAKCTKLTYKNIYPGIDWVLYIKDNSLKYDFIVHSGGNARNIKLKYGGATGLKLENGSFTASTSLGSVTEQAPRSFDLEGQPIPSSFKWHDATLSFETMGKYDGLVIDPMIDWATYYGGTGNDIVRDVATDNSGALFACGETQSIANIATTGSYQSTIGGSSDGMLIKFNPQGVRQWATYYGGAGADVFTSICIDNSGAIYIGGGTNSITNISTPGAHQPSYGGTGLVGDGLILKLSSGGLPVWCSYYGGSEQDRVTDITCTGIGDIYFTGFTRSSSGIATTGSHQPLLSDSLDGFLAKFNSQGTQQWATYYGGTGNDNSNTVALAANGDVYIAGATTSPAGLSTPGAHQPAYAGSTDGFIAGFTNSGVRNWGTYYGGAAADGIVGITVAGTAHVYIAGNSSGTTAIATPGSHQQVLGGLSDAFVGKFTTTGIRLWGTYYGGSSSDQANCITLMNSGEKLLLGGSTKSSNNIATAGAWQTSPVPPDGIMLYAEFDTSGLHLFGSYYGSNSSGFYNGSAIYSIQHDPVTSRIYCGGLTNADSMAVYSAHQSAFGGITDGFVFCLLNPNGLVTAPVAAAMYCTGQSFSLMNTVTGSFLSYNTFSVELSNSSGSFIAPVVIGTANNTTSGNIICTVPANAAAGNGYRIRVTASYPAQVSQDNGANIVIHNSVVPSVLITANPGTTISQGTNVSFTATATNGGTNPAFQWKKNGLNIPGATAGVYSTSAITNNDQFNVILTSNELCSLPPVVSSNVISMQVVTGISSFAGAIQKATVYPNPGEHSVLEVILDHASSINITITDATGKVLSRQTQPFKKTMLQVQLPSSLSDGVYFIRVSDDEGLMNIVKWLKR